MKRLPMTKTRFASLSSLKPGAGYSDLVIANGFAFVAGIVAADSANVVDRGVNLGRIEDETRICMELLGETLAIAGLDFDDIVKVTIFMKNLDEFDRMNAVYRSFFRTGREPARTTVGVADILLGCRIEIESIARMTAADLP
jgi:2-iminobutanoate/2-iminopropanoate deaminase